MADTYKYGEIKYTDRPVIVDSTGREYDISFRDFGYGTNVAHNEEIIELNKLRGRVHAEKDQWEETMMIGCKVFFLPERRKESRNIYIHATPLFIYDEVLLAVLPKDLEHPVNDPQIIKASVLIILEALGSMAHVDHGRYAAERMQFYVHKDMLASTLLGRCLKDLQAGNTAASKKWKFYRETSRFWDSCVPNVTYDSLHSGTDTYVEKTGAEFKGLGLQWRVIGQQAKANPAPVLETDKTLAENRISSSNLIQCKAWLPDNKLMSYPA